jgi:hypothetical protein
VVIVDVGGYSGWGLNSADVEEELRSVRYYLGYAELFVCIALSRNLSMRILVPYVALHYTR